MKSTSGDVVDAAGLNPATLLHLSGVEPVEMTDAELDALVAFVSAGGTVLLETAGGLGGFADDAAGQLGRRLGAEAKWLGADDPVISGAGLRGGTDRRRVEHRRYTAIHGDAEPRPSIGVIAPPSGGRVLVSSRDLSLGALGCGYFRVNGYAVGIGPRAAGQRAVVGGGRGRRTAGRSRRVRIPVPNAAVSVALAWAAGSALGAVGWERGAGYSAVGAGVGLAVAAVGVGLLVVADRGARGGRRATGSGVFWVAALATSALGLGAAWSAQHGGEPPALTITVPGEVDADAPRLVQVEGRVVNTPEVVAPREGPFAPFAFGSPATRFELALTHAGDGAARVAVSGSLLVRVEEADAELRAGQFLKVRGWWSGFDPPPNPGEFDFAAFARRRGLVGRLRVPRRDNIVERRPATPSAFARLRGAWQDAARRSLALGWGSVSQSGGNRSADETGQADGANRALPLLELLLLGETHADTQTTRRGFREAGLSHLLSISGAHVGALLWVVWLIARGVSPHPRWAGVVVLIVLAGYLLLVPPRVPIVRAAIMAALLAGGAATGRRLPGATLWAVALWITLMVWPHDVFDAGFQLSFAAVGALIFFVPGLAARWGGPGPGDPGFGLDDAGGRWVATRDALRAGRRVVAAAFAVGTVAFLAAAPLVARHFLMVNPWSLITSVLAVPVLIVVLVAGYVKIAVGLAMPGLGALLAGPLGTAARFVLTGVEASRSLPGAVWWLRAAPPWAWVLAAWMVVAAGLGCMARPARAEPQTRRGLRARRAGHGALVVGALGVVGTLGLLQTDTPGAALRGEPRPLGSEAVAARLSAVAVRDGSCFVLQCRDGDGDGDGDGGGGTVRTLVFDCGSQQLSGVGRRAVLPVLRSLGVSRVDVLVISHADLDHYNGVPDLLDALPVDAVWVSPDVPAEVAAAPGRATSVLWDALAARGLTARVVTRGDRLQLGSTALEVLWPPAPVVNSDAGARTGGEANDARPWTGNDGSVVLRATVAGRRLLLSGDIQERATDLLLQDPAALRADVADLPHHGAFIRNSVAWLDAVDPAWVIQSCGTRRFRGDKWAAALAERPQIRRGATARDGFVQVQVGRDGRLGGWGFVNTPP